MATITLIEKSKEELIDIILRHERRIADLEKENAELKKKKEQKFVKANVVHRHRLKPGRKAGHIGCTRPTPEHIDETIISGLSACPHCQHRLGEPVETVDHIQEDIVPAHKVVTCYRKHRYYCPQCQRVVSAAYHETEIPHSYLGPNVLIQAMLLKYRHHLPYESIREIFNSFATITVTEGALAQAFQRISTWLAVEQDAIAAAIRSSPSAHMDETGWRVDGQSHWLWEMVNEKLAYYRIDRSRSRAVARSMLGNFSGILISDFYSVYQKLGLRQQKCLVHLLREMDRCRMSDQSQEFKKHYKKLRRILGDAERLKNSRATLAPWVFFRRLAALKERLLNFASASFDNKNWQRLSQRLLLHYEQLLTFLEVPGIPSHNNHAERLIRPNVINRNRSFGNRSVNGATAHAVSMSIIQSLKLQKRTMSDALKRAYIQHRQGIHHPVLF